MENVEAVSDAIRAMGYNVSSNIEYIDSMKKQFAMVQAVLGGIGAVSLFVAAIGIANTMMMSAAINALVKGKEMGMTTGQISYIPLWLVLVSLGFAMLVGTAAGYFPARRAMKLSPLAAIRNE